jgi:hypothetical protein
VTLKGSLISHRVIHRKDAKDAEACFFLLSVEGTESKKIQSCVEIKRTYNLSMCQSQSNAGLALTGDYCSEAAERFAFAGLSAAKANSVISAYFASLAKRAVNAQHIL